MPQIIIMRRDVAGVLATIVLECTVKSAEHCTDEQFAEILLEAERNGNSSGEVRVHFNGF